MNTLICIACVLFIWREVDLRWQIWILLDEGFYTWLAMRITGSIPCVRIKTWAQLREWVNEAAYTSWRWIIFGTPNR